MRAEEVAEALNIPRRRVWKLARTGQLPVVRIGREIRIDPDDLAEWIARRKTRRPTSRE